MVKATCYDSIGNLLEKLHQWDMNRYIKVEGLDITDGADVMFHFCNERSSTTLVVEASLNENGYVGVVPNELLEKPDTIYLYVYEKFGDPSEKRTVEIIRIPLVPRKRPDDYVYEPTPTLKVATGLILDNGTIYLAEGGKKFGTGVSVSGTSVAGQTIPHLYGMVVSIIGNTTLVEGG